MVLAVSPVMPLEKVPMPVPSLVLLLAMVGLLVVDQHTPRAVTEAPPSYEMVPPVDEDVLVMAVIWVVLLMVGMTAVVVRVI